MPPLPTIADVYRCRLILTSLSGVKPVNTIHVLAPSSSVSAVAAAFNTNATADMVRPISSGIDWQGVSITPLDGTTAETDHIFTTHKTGGATGEVIWNMAACLSFKSNQRGPQGRGRVFLGPTTEGINSSGVWTPSDASACSTAWGVFFAALTTAGIIPVVASYVHSAAYPIVSIRADNALCSQRRRLDRFAGR